MKYRQETRMPSLGEKEIEEKRKKKKGDETMSRIGIFQIRFSSTCLAEFRTRFDLTG
jgi:hypothetical protein